MSSESALFPHVDAAVFRSLKKNLTALGYHVPAGNSGEFKSQLVTLDFAWDEAASSLAITIKEKPSFISNGAIIWKIQEALKTAAPESDKD